MHCIRENGDTGYKKTEYPKPFFFDIETIQWNWKWYTSLRHVVSPSNMFGVERAELTKNSFQRIENINKLPYP